MEVVINLLDLFFRITNLFLPALLLFFIVSYFALSRRKKKAIFLFILIELISVVYYIVEIKTGFFGLYSNLFFAEVLYFIASAVANNALYVILISYSTKEIINNRKRGMLIMIAPLITTIIILYFRYK